MKFTLKLPCVLQVNYLADIVVHLTLGWVTIELVGMGRVVRSSLDWVAIEIDSKAEVAVSMPMKDMPVRVPMALVMVAV